MIEVQDIVKSFDGTVVLDHISTEMYDGKVNMIIGQSGSGKTVLMKSLIGLYPVDSGKIIYKTQIPQATSERGMMTVLENVKFPLEMFSKQTEEEMTERARFCLERVNIPERAFALMPSEISGGMQKRVAIARAISMNPKYLFCDEPNSGLDPKTSIVIDQLIHELTEEYNMCTVINSHDMNSIMEIGDHIVFLKNGKKEWQGSRFDIFHTGNEALDDFVFASDLFKKVKMAVGTAADKEQRTMNKE